MFIENIADYLQKLKKRDIKPEIFTVFEFPDDLTILEILNSIGYRLANLFGFVKINTTTKTVDTGEASVNVTGDVDNLNFDFTIPRGKTGPQGPTGPGVATGGTTGQVLVKKSNANFDTEWINAPGGGSTVSVNVGETTTGEPGTNASVTNSGDETNVVLNFTIPRGDTGPTGPTGKQGPAGAPGPTGPGVATGGTTGQVLAKKSNANFDTEWINAPGGGSGLTKTVLWHNNSPRTAFESQTITTTENGFDYPLLIIEFAESSGGFAKLSVVATDTTLIGTNATMLSYYKGYRTIRTSSGTSWRVSAGFNISTNTTDNDVVIPLNIIGYK